MEKNFSFSPISYYCVLKIWKRLFGRGILEAVLEVNFDGAVVNRSAAAPNAPQAHPPEIEKAQPIRITPFPPLWCRRGDWPDNG